MSRGSWPAAAPPPQSEAELMTRANAIAGLSLGDLAAHLSVVLPENLRRAKGLVGQLVELVLGASAGVQAKPDFLEIGVELKTLPLNAKHQPKESTYVCTLPLLPETTTWQQSVVYAKLSRVLWLPVEADSAIPLAKRRLGSPILWSPDAEQEAVLRDDWEEITDYVLHGELDKLDASCGEALHIRPKAMHGKALSWAIDAEGNKVQTLPRGFYLRQRFTGALLAQ